MKKRIFAVLLLAALALALCACGGHISPPVSSEPTLANETESVVLNPGGHWLSCEVIEENGKLVHYMNKGGPGYVSEHWEMERYLETSGGDEEWAESRYSLFNNCLLVTDVIPELDIEWPESFLPLMFHIVTPEFAETKFSDSDAFSGIQFEGDICPYTGLAIAEHDVGKVYYPTLRLEDLAEFSTSFSIADGEPSIRLYVQRDEKGDKFYENALVRNNWIDTEYNGRMLGLTGAGDISAVTFNGDSSVCVTMHCENLTFDELLALMDDNGLWELWDVLMNA